MALLWRMFLYVREAVLVAEISDACDAVESATQKENGVVLGRSPKNEKVT